MSVAISRTSHKNEFDLVVFDRYYCSFMMPARIADNEVANRPGWIEARILKQRRHRYPLMQCQRDRLRTVALPSD